jgi:hypothetical protein
MGLNLTASTISSINRLNQDEKRKIYTRIIPPELYERFQLSPNLTDEQGRDLVNLRSDPGRTDVQLALYHRADFPDPILYGHLTDTLNGQLHILLYILNDPFSSRFNVDRLDDGRTTSFGTERRNISAEIAAMQAGLAPGQVRRGLRLLKSAINAFEAFVTSLGHELYFVEPLYYHNALIFESYGFSYQKGHKLMAGIQHGFKPSGDLFDRLDGSTPFRQPAATHSIRLRSWAIHDGLLGEPYSNVTMYKYVGKKAEINSCPDCDW